MMKTAIGYLRVSTEEQGRSGFGLAAQQKDIETFAQREGFAVKSWHQDVQTGAGADALVLRSGLARALKQAKAEHNPLIVSRLDRLSQNVHFITGLMEHKVHFIVAALGRDCDELTLHIYASLAEQERKMISERVKAAHAAARCQGRKPSGIQSRPKAWRRRFHAMGLAAKQKAADERAEAYRLQIEWALRQTSWHGGVITFTEAAKKLNERGVLSPKGGEWATKQVRSMARRLKLEHPLLLYPTDGAIRLGIKALLKEHPDCTADEVRKSPRWTLHLGMQRAYRILKEVRIATLERSAIRRRIGWPVDRWTEARLHIARTLQRRPQLVAWQVVQELRRGPHSRITVHWVRRAMQEVRCGSCAESQRRNRYWKLKRRARLRSLELATRSASASTVKRLRT
jgi:DNA invertase Pin-like site-specific DNA recombinase